MNSSNLRPVARSDIQIGQPLPFSVFDRNGLLLLKEGFVVHMQRQLDNLIANGMRKEGVLVGPLGAGHREMPTQREEEHATFEVLDLVKLRLRRLFDNYRVGKRFEDFVARVENLASTVQEACTHDSDSALANLHLDYESAYAVIHHTQAATVCELIGKKLGVPEEARLQLICAALTHDLGLIDIQDRLDAQEQPLSPEQKARIDRHPADGDAILRALGVTNDTWLDAVRHHHERIDGSGYPDCLAGDALRIPTRILAVADMYSAMVRDRPYRKAMVSRAAMRQLMQEQGGRIDERFIKLMIREVGVFPPGAIVKLASGEVAVVWKRQGNTTCPIVQAFVRPDGMPMLTPRRRDTSADGYAIEGMLPFSGYRGSIAIIRSLWDMN
ncbi:MAG: HD domain-containing protein [Rhodocyclaceae bacterium]|nr:HD domain-containing protein [Rhodocyclaceae bacterium]